MASLGTRARWGSSQTPATLQDEKIWASRHALILLSSRAALQFFLQCLVLSLVGYLRTGWIEDLLVTDAFDWIMSSGC